MYKTNKVKKSQKNRKQSKRSLSPLVIASIVVIALAVAGTGTYTYLSNRDAGHEPESIVADPDFSDGTDRTPSDPIKRNGSVTDTSDEPEKPDETDQHDPIVSSSGNITVNMPRPNQALKSGDTISGTAKVDRVWYRLIDDQVGNIVQGSLKVTDGRFSGVFDFSTSGSEGRLDIFSMEEDGTEADNIEIDIRFK